MIVFRTKNETVLKKMAEEMSDLVTEDTFRQVYGYAMEGDPHNFLFVDMAPKDPTKKFRRNFDTYIITPELDGSAGGKRKRGKFPKFDSQKGVDRPGPQGVPQN